MEGGVSMAPPLAWDEATGTYCVDGRLQVTQRLTFPQSSNMIKVSPTQSGFADEVTIGAALARAAAMNASTALTPVVIRVDPGVYHENNPLVVPAGVVVYGYSTLTTTVIATNPAAPVFRLSPRGTVRDLTVVGSAVAGVEYLGSASPAGLGTVQGVLFTGCAIGVHATSGPSPVFVNECAFVASSAGVSVGVGVLASAGASLHVTVSYSAARYTVTGAIETWVGCVAQAVGARAVVNIIGGGFGGALVGAQSSSGGTVSLNGVIFRDCATTLQVADGFLDATSLVVERSVMNDLSIMHESASVRLSFCTLDQDKVSNPLGVQYRGVTYSAVEKATVVTGELNVGTPQHPSPTYLGCGDSSASTLVGIKYNPTTEAYTQLPNPGLASTPDFEPLGAQAGSCFYLGSSTPFYAVEYGLAASPSTEFDANVAVECWDGAAWVAASRMVTQYEHPMASRKTRMFSGASGTGEVMRIAFAGWQRCEVMAVSRYWMRLRLLSPVAEVPLLAFAAPFYDTMRVSASGSVERFGEAQPERDLGWSISSAGVFGVLVGPRLSAGLGVSLSDNIFPKASAVTMGLATRLPASVDTSRGVQFGLVCVGAPAAGAGVVNWTVRWAVTPSVGAPLTDTPPTTAPGEQVVEWETQVPASTGVSKSFVAGPFVLDVQQYCSRYEEFSQADILWVSITRGSPSGVPSPDDTYDGDVRVLEMRASAFSAFD